MPNEYNKDRNYQTPAKQQPSDYAKSEIQDAEDRIKGIADNFQKQIKQGQEQLGQLAAKADKQVRENPWPVVIGVGAVAFLLGCVVGKSTNSD